MTAVCRFLAPAASTVDAGRATFPTTPDETASSGMPGDQRGTMHCTVPLRATLS